nr:MFS-type transporter clz9-like [Hydra vulgaris]
MQQAVLSVINGDHGYKKAAAMYGVPQTTLERRVAKFKKNPNIEDACKKTLDAFKTIFTWEKEAELVQYVRQMEKMLFGLTFYELRKLAFELAEKNKKAHKFNKEEGVAGYDWYQGISTVPKLLSKVISTKGKRQVGSLTSAERGQLVTAVVCCSASGRYMPPMLIFPRQRMKVELMDRAPPGAWAECHPSGWIQTDLFINWLKKFILHTEATKDSTVFLILDGHTTHTKSIELIDTARENGIILFCLPPHCTHKMQPLDISFMKPLSKFYDHNLRKWLRTNPGHAVTQFKIASLFGASYLDVATMTNAINGFKKAGIWPVDRSVFTDADFIAAEVTDMSIITEDTESFVTKDSALTTVSAPATKPSDSTSTTEPSTSCTGSTFATEPSTSCRPSTSTTVPSSFAISPRHLLPIPKQAQRKPWFKSYLSNSKQYISFGNEKN